MTLADGENGRGFRAPVLSATAIAFATAAVYFAAAKVGLTMAVVAEQVTVVWPPSGLALVAVLLIGSRSTLLGVAVPLGVALGAFLANVTSSEPVPTAMGIAVGNTAEALLGAWLLARAGFKPTLERLRDVLALVVLAAVGSTTVSATVGTGSLCLGGVHPWQEFGRLWLEWWVGDCLGDLVAAPLLLVWMTVQPVLRPSERRGEAAALLAVMLVVGSAVFLARPPARLSDYPIHYSVFPIVIWGALRFGQRGTATTTFLVAGIAIWSTVRGSGLFGVRTMNDDSLLMLQLFMAVVAITGLVLGAAITERDVARLRAAREYDQLQRSEERLAAVDRRKDEFLAMLSHELRNPLGSLSAALRVMRADGNTPAPLLGLAERQVQHLVRLVDDLLDVSRITQGKIVLRRQSIALDEVVDSAVEMIRPLLDSQGHAFHVALPPQRVELDADPGRLAQILANLLDNAAKYTPRGGSISLTAERSTGGVAIRIRDSGPGIAPELLPSVFDLFVQGGRSLDRAAGGLGIGLTIVRRLVELHDGQVDVRSFGPGAGSEFVVQLPVPSPASDRGARGRRTRAVADRGRGGRVLIVEDHRDAALSLMALIARWGYEVRVAENGAEALDMLRTWPPNAVISDIGLPGIDGYQLARELRARPEHAHTILIALSGYGRDEDRRLALDAGYDHHFTKPADLDRLRASLEWWAGRRAGGFPDASSWRTPA